MSKRNFSDQIRTPRRRVAVAISAFGFFGVLAKYSYVFFINDRKNGEVFELFGYKYLSRFLWAFGNEVFAFVIGTLLWVSTVLMVKKSSYRLPFRLIGFLTMGTAIYFSVWIFYDGNKFTKTVEVVGAIVFSLISATVFTIFLKVLTREIRNVQELKSDFLDFLVEVRNINFKELLKVAMKKDLYDTTYQEELKEATKKFEDRLYDKAEEIVEIDE